MLRSREEISKVRLDDIEGSLKDFFLEVCCTIGNHVSKI